jgi:hypothetical protein
MHVSKPHIISVSSIMFIDIYFQLVINFSDSHLQNPYRVA